MPKLLTRIVTLLLIPFLLADPSTATAFSVAPSRAGARASEIAQVQNLFQQEAIVDPVIRVLKFILNKPAAPSAEVHMVKSLVFPAAARTALGGVLASLLWIALAALPARGQNAWSVATAGANTTPNMLTNSPTHRDEGLLSLRYSRGLFQKRNVRMDYVAEFLPVFLVHEPREYFYDWQGSIWPHDPSDPYYVGLGRGSQNPRTVFSTGASPVGFRWTFGPPSLRLAPYTEGGVGFLESQVPIPYQVKDGTRFNFTAQFGGGLRLRTQSGREFFIGYRLFHVSNAGRSVNPGIDANQFELGATLPAVKLPWLRHRAAHRRVPARGLNGAA